MENNISDQNAFKLKQWSANIYNTAVILDYFCSTQTQYAELNNITQIIQNVARMQIVFTHILLI